MQQQQSNTKTITNGVTAYGGPDLVAEAMGHIRTSIKKRKQSASVFVAKWRSIFTRFKGFGVLDRTTSLLTVDCNQFVAIEIGSLAKTVAALLAQPGATLVRRGWHLVEIAPVVGQPFVYLGCVTMERIQLLLDHLVNGNYNIRLKRIGFLEVVPCVDDGRHDAQVWHMGDYIGYRE